MLFSHKSTAILHVLPDSLVWYGKNQKPVALPLTTDVLQYMEVVDPAKAKALLNEFFAQPAAKNQRVVVALADDIIFNTALPADKTADPAKALQDFIDAVPFDPANRAAITAQQHKTWFAVAANRQWLRLITDALLAAKNKIVHIAPIGSYGVPDSKKLTPSVLSQLANYNKTAAVFDFLPQL